MSDTTTTLNPGSGGDVMDESSVTQAAGTAAKRPRVVLGDDLGGIYSPGDIVRLLEQVVREMRAHTVLLQALLASTASPMGIDEIYDASAAIHNE